MATLKTSHVGPILLPIGALRALKDGRCSKVTQNTCAYPQSPRKCTFPCRLPPLLVNLFNPLCVVNPILLCATDRAPSHKGKMFRRVAVPKRHTFGRFYSNFIPLRHRPQPFKTFLQTCGIVLGTVSVYVSYHLYQNKPVFIPLWISKGRKEAHSDIDLKYVKLVAEEQVLERLSLDSTIQREFRLPLKATFQESEFVVWCEERNTSMKGINITPGPRFKWMHRPVTLHSDFELLLEELGGEDQYKIPVVNSNKEADSDLWFQGKVLLVGQNDNRGDVVFRGIFDGEHTKQAKVLRAELVRNVNGKKKKSVLWDRT